MKFFIFVKWYFFFSTINYFRNLKIFYIITNSLWDLPSPSSINYFWNFGSVLGLCFLIQIFSGLFLRFHYISYSFESFDSVILIIRDVWFGWFIRFFHMNGASLFFFFLYFHLFRGVYFFSSVHKFVWLSGSLILLLIMAVSFLGYVLPWGQMSYWGVAVITNLFSVVPFIGDFLVIWIWGGFTVGLPTLIRFYSFHFILPFVVLFIVLIHLIFLHSQGSSNPLGLDSNFDKLIFHPFFTVKDFFFFLIVLIFFMFFCFYFPYLFRDPVNNIPANFMQTPLHIQPEWYFLPYYAILRSIPRKSGGVLSLLLSVLVFSFLVVYSYNFSLAFRQYRKIFFWSFICCFFFLMKIGSLPAEEPYVFLSKIFSLFYFFFILVLNL